MRPSWLLRKQTIASRSFRQRVTPLPAAEMAATIWKTWLPIVQFGLWKQDWWCASCQCLLLFRSLGSLFTVNEKEVLEDATSSRRACHELWERRRGLLIGARGDFPMDERARHALRNAFSSTCALCLYFVQYVPVLSSLLAREYWLIVLVQRSYGISRFDNANCEQDRTVLVLVL